MGKVVQRFCPTQASSLAFMDAVTADALTADEKQIRQTLVEACFPHLFVVTVVCTIHVSTIAASTFSEFVNMSKSVSPKNK